MTKLNCNIIFCDIDATITDSRDTEGPSFRDAVFAMFAEQIASVQDIPISQARDTLEEFANNQLVWWDFPDFISEYQLSSSFIWPELRKIHREQLKVYDDAVEMVKYLHEAGKDLYIISNNPVTACLLKLELAGLATLSGTPYFQRIFGTNIIRGCKSVLQAWERAIFHLGVEPEKILTIGDNVAEDYQMPHQAGIQQTIIVDRNADTPIAENNDYVIVNNLTQVKNLL